jgi:Bacteriophage tail tube protein
MGQNATIYVMESVNLICGDTRSAVPGGVAAPGISTHLTLQELKLPAIEENFVDHTPGGAPIGIEIPTHMNKLEATFNLAGWDAGLMTYIGKEDPYNHRFTAYGLIRDRRTSRALQAIAVIEGRLGRVNPTAFSKGTLQHHEYSIKSIVHYELSMQTNETGQTLYPIYHWDFFTSERVIGGKDLNDDLITMLRIPGAVMDVTPGSPTSPAEAGGTITNS